ncbi:hypothetical protein [Sphingomonas sp. RIT328]|uniref:hypothetical protein n=1 Tax=Sphingomonas sp. RIT328 TaxID=1470591 RepID=UPI00044AE8C1|nr:hypothetical protein [Sphingomonas sp. RIT328]EZP57435.1 hypothetical protein BW41_00280 [Sphingomonas sp. RIT328]
MKIKVIRAYSGEEGVGPDKDVREGSEHTVTRARGSQLKANGLVEILSDDDDESGELKTDGPTVGEYVAAGYPAKNYPPAGYASRSTGEEIAEAIRQQESAPMTNEPAAPKAVTPPKNKNAPAPSNKAAPKPANKSA